MRPHYLTPLIVVTLAVVGCDVRVGRFAEDRAVALTATQNLRDLYNKQEFERIYGLGAPVLRAQITPDAFVAAVASSMHQSGRFVSTNLVASSCFPNEVRLVYHSKFEKGEFTESILWAVPTNNAKLVMYKLSPGHAAADRSLQKNCPT